MEIMGYDIEITPAWVVLCLTCLVTIWFVAKGYDIFTRIAFSIIIIPFSYIIVEAIKNK